MNSLVQGQMKFVAQINVKKYVKSYTLCFNHDDSSSKSLNIVIVNGKKLQKEKNIVIR
jgi:hypothetical protein